MTTTASITFKLSPESFSCIIDMAGYGVGYWASYMSSVNSDVPWEGIDEPESRFFCYKCCHFTDAESGDEFLITPEIMEQAVLDLYVKAPLNDYYMTAIRYLVTRGCTGDVGSDIADAIVQQACFGKVIYG